MIKSQLISLLQLSEEQLKQPVILAQHPQHPPIHFLILNQKANVFNDDFIRQIHFALDKVEANEGPTVLITTSFHPSIFSAGLDLNVVGKCDYYMRTNYVMSFIRLLGRILSLCVPTIALVNGHAIAGGCMLMFAHDWRFGRAEQDKAKIALNEIELGMWIPPGMNAVCQCKLTPNVHRDLTLLARRYDLGTEGVKYQIVEDVATEDKLVEMSIKKAAQVAKYGVDKENFHKIKCQVYKEALDACFNQQMASNYNYFVGLPKL